MSLAIPVGHDTFGLSLPSSLHAIAVSYPKWSDVVAVKKGESATVNAMMTGYPRFYVHRSVQKLITICQKEFGLDGEMCLLCPTAKTAECGNEYIRNLALLAGRPSEVRVVCCVIEPASPSSTNEITSLVVSPTAVLHKRSEVHILFFPGDTYTIARQFWQNCGLGISSRYAEHCLSLLGVPGFPQASLSDFVRFCGRTSYPMVMGKLKPKPQDESELPLSTGVEAKVALRRRIASFFVHDETSARNVSEDDVYLFPTGMSALWNAHQLLLATRPPDKSVVFGFPYTDTLKIIQRSGPGAIFYGHGRDSDIDDLDNLLTKKVEENPSSSPPVLALYTECPSNPLLRTVNMPRLRALADKYNFLIVIDETVGTFANVDVLPYADLIVTSLSKYFGGYATALGGSLVINPRMRYHAVLKGHLGSVFEDTYFDLDAIVLERNSRDFLERMRITNANAEYVCDFLHARSIEGGAPESEGAVIKKVHYPKYMSSEHYEICRRRLPGGKLDSKNGGYTGLFSLTFTSMKASRTFYDALEAAKGPSLGTTFTLTCSYTFLSHHHELEWAAEFGVEEGLVRVSVGTEDREALLEVIVAALSAAELA
ncbi:pyridoxal phosphate-dependent transferase [Pisolithus croceorrhizus]|nr:pyridoxal phosphate-dependent transferase [Pisolithus croceorrhizus]